MAHLLKIEWLKIKNYRAFWVFAILYLASIFLVNYIGWSAQQRAFQTEPMAEQVLGNSYAFPKVWHTVGWMSSWLLYFPGMLIIMLMTNEFNFKTHRQNIIDGLSRQQFIGVKIMMVLILAVLITLLNFITALVFGVMVIVAIVSIQSKKRFVDGCFAPGKSPFIKKILAAVGKRYLPKNYQTDGCGIISSEPNQVLRKNSGPERRFLRCAEGQRLWYSGS